MLILIAIWAVAEATLFFIVADVPIMALGIKAGLRKALIGAVVAAVCAALGGSYIYFWSSTNPKDVMELLFAVPAIDEALLVKVWEDWQDGGSIAMMIGSFSGEPYKLYAHAAGSAPGSGTLPGLLWFFFASILARLPRFVLVALVAGWLGPQLRDRFGAAPVWIVFGLAWAVFYAWYWSVMGF